MNTADEVRAIVQQYLGWYKSSGPYNISAICPFHVKPDGSPERHPSFYMNTQNGLYFCHSCETRGNLYTFLRDLGVPRDQIAMRHQLVIEAVARNIPPAMSPLDPKIIDDNPLPEYLLGMFDMCPTSLLNAGFTADTLKSFDVGFDSEHLRVVFPLRDLAGNLTGISGRDVEGHKLRYKIYDREYEKWGLPARPSLNKRSILWNIHRVYPTLFFNSKPGEIVLVEGFKACMWVWQAGIKNVVALLGTFLTDEQRWILERLGGTVYLFFDHNEAGHTAYVEAGRKLSKSLNVKVMEYPKRIGWEDDAQPDNLSAQEVIESKGRAVDYVSWLYGLN